jgi:hypothetical protein
VGEPAAPRDTQPGHEPATKGVSLSGTLPDRPESTCSRIRRAIDFHRRHAGHVGLGLWVASAAVLAVHSTGEAFPNPTRFAMLDAWLIGLGCIGSPLLALRTLGRWLQPEACRGIAICAFTLALVLTALTIGGALHFNTLDGLFAVILPEAAGIQALNAAEAEVHARLREERAYRRGRLDTLAEAFAQRQAALAGISHLEDMSVAELEDLEGKIAALLDEKRAGAPALRLLPRPPRSRRRHHADHA